MPPKKVAELCRLCSLDKRAKIDIFEGEGEIRLLHSKISSCLPVKVLRNDKLPKRICEDCMYKVEMFNDFREATLKSEKELNKFLEEEEKAENEEKERMERENAASETSGDQGDGSPAKEPIVPVDVVIKTETDDVTMDEDEHILGLSDASDSGGGDSKKTEEISKEEDMMNSSDDNSGGEFINKEEDIDSDYEYPQNIQASTFVSVEVDNEQPGPSGLSSGVPSNTDAASSSATASTSATEQPSTSSENLELIARSIVSGCFQLFKTVDKPKKKSLVASEQDERCAVGRDDKLTGRDCKNLMYGTVQGGEFDAIGDDGINLNEQNNMKSIYDPMQEAGFYATDEYIDDIEGHYSNSVQERRFDVMVKDSDKLTEQNSKNSACDAGSITPCNSNNFMHDTVHERGTSVIGDGVDDNISQLSKKEPVYNIVQEKKFDATADEANNVTGHSSRNSMYDTMQEKGTVTVGDHTDNAAGHSSKSSVDLQQLSANSKKKKNTKRNYKKQEKVIEAHGNNTDNVAGHSSENSVVNLQQPSADSKKRKTKKINYKKQEKAIEAHGNNTDNVAGHSSENSVNSQQPSADSKKKKSTKRNYKKREKGTQALGDHTDSISGHSFMQSADSHLLLGNSMMKTEKDNKEIPSRRKRKNSYQCEICGQMYTTQTGLVYHKRIHNGERCFPCKFCSKILATPSSQAAHMLRHSKEQNFPCTKCHKSYYDRSSLMNHEKKHNKDPPYKCQYCGKGFYSKHNFRDHENQHTGERDYRCKICEVIFISCSAFRLHMETHNPEVFSCDLCGKSFEKRRVLYKHVLRHNSVPQSFTCEECGKVVRSHQSLKAHLRIHTGEKPFTCEICGKQIRSRNLLKEHLRTHTGEKPYACEICDKRFTQAHNLTFHKRTHK